METTMSEGDALIWAALVLAILFLAYRISSLLWSE
jgi:hypothetical protein